MEGKELRPRKHCIFYTNRQYKYSRMSLTYPYTKKVRIGTGTVLFSGCSQLSIEGQVGILEDFFNCIDFRLR